MSTEQTADRAKNSRAAQRAERLGRLRATALCTLIENPTPRGLPRDEPAIIAGGSPFLAESMADMALPLAELPQGVSNAECRERSDDRLAADLETPNSESRPPHSPGIHTDPHAAATAPPPRAIKEPQPPLLAPSAGQVFRFDAAEGLSPRAPLAMPAFTLTKPKTEQLEEPIRQLEKALPSPYPVGELYRQLRQNVLGHLAPGQAATVWICPTGSEPLSDHLVELASALAEGCDGEILLVDANFQAASLTRRFNLGDKSGLADVLAKKLAAHAAGHETAVARVRVLPKGGDAVGRASRRANEEEWRSLLAGFKERYSYVLIDAPGIEEPHCLPLAKAADAAYVAIALDHTPRETVQEALEHLHLHKARVAGCVITEAPA